MFQYHENLTLDKYLIYMKPMNFDNLFNDLCFRKIKKLKIPENAIFIKSQSDLSKLKNEFLLNNFVMMEDKFKINSSRAGEKRIEKLLFFDKDEDCVSLDNPENYDIIFVHCFLTHIMVNI